MTPFLSARFGGLPRSFWLLWTGTVVNRLGTVVQPFLAVYLHTGLGLSLAATGLQIAVFGAGQAASQVVGGWLTDRVGRLATMVTSLLASAAVMLLVGATTGPPALTVAVFLLGLAIDAYRPAATALVADVVAPPDRARAYGLLFWAVNLGFSGAMVLGGVFESVSAHWLFWTNSLCAALFAGILLLGRVDRPAAPDRTARPAGGFGTLLRDRLMVTYCLITLVYGIVYAQAYSTLPIAMVDGGLGAAGYGVAVAMNGVVIVVLQPLVGPWAARRDHNTVFAVGVLLVGTGFGLCAVATNLATYIVTVLIWTLGEIAIVSVGQAIVMTLSPEHLRGRYSGVWGTAWGGAAAVVGPALGTWLLGIGADVLWSTCAVACAVAAFLQWRIGAAIRRRAVSAPRPSRPAVRVPAAHPGDAGR
ncbi:MFS transporter [Virgisporangium aurantiacum]|uniref:MFS transporter n=1 Tax=Virgisporangium aurantiacum TaxID=175570 RepID=A0A8J3Z6D4_9ACTN|nr:MFS transporter [Virgisporangium aurantiacum]GIJ57782.1 MFS transporter [Virgisporangium aurantiacum]